MPYPGHGGMLFPSMDWYAYRAKNSSGVTMIPGLAARWDTDGSNLCARVSYDGTSLIGSVEGHKCQGFVTERIGPLSSCVLQRAGFVTNARCYGTVAVGDWVRMSSLIPGGIKQEDISTRTGAVFGFALDNNTTSAGSKKIRILLLPWRI